MKTKAVRSAAALALLVFAAPMPARGQFYYPPLIVVPPPAQDYGARPRDRKPARPDQAKPADTPPPPKPSGHFQGRIYVPD